MQFTFLYFLKNKLDGSSALIVFMKARSGNLDVYRCNINVFILQTIRAELTAPSILKNEKEELNSQNANTKKSFYWLSKAGRNWKQFTLPEINFVISEFLTKFLYFSSLYWKISNV